MDGRVAQAGEFRGEGFVLQESGQRQAGRFDATGVDRHVARFSADFREAGGVVAGLRVTRIAAGAEELGNAELFIDMLAESGEVPVLAQEPRQPPPGRPIRRLEVGREFAVGCRVRQEPLQGEAGVEGEEQAEAGGEDLVAHQGAVGRRDAVAGKIGF